MKKIWSAVLALALCLFAFAALAEGSPSITMADLISVKDQVEGLELSIPDNQTITITQLMKLSQAGSAADYFGDETVESFIVDEFFAVAFEKIPAFPRAAREKEVLVPVSFKVTRSYENGEMVIVKLGMLNGAEMEWLSFEAAVENNRITIEMKPEELAALLGRTVLVAVLSK